MITSDLSGRRILVTGASSGIGEATCRTLIRCGASVAMLARRPEHLDALCAEFGGLAIAVPCDVTDLDALKTGVDAAAEALDGLDGVITAAGRGMVGTLATGTPQAWIDLFDLNLIGPLATIRYALEHFSDGRRDVVLVGSTGSLTPTASLGVYAAAKRGLRAAFDSLRLELAPHSINVGLIMPGVFDTEGLMAATTVDGDITVDAMPKFAGDITTPPPPTAVAYTIAFMLAMPNGICINELVIRPTAQLAP